MTSPKSLTQKCDCFLICVAGDHIECITPRTSQIVTHYTDSSPGIMNSSKRATEDSFRKSTEEFPMKATEESPMRAMEYDARSDSEDN